MRHGQSADSRENDLLLRRTRARSNSGYLRVRLVLGARSCPPAPGRGGQPFFLLNTSRRREGDRLRRSTVIRLYST